MLLPNYMAVLASDVISKRIDGIVILVNGNSLLAMEESSTMTSCYFFSGRIKIVLDFNIKIEG